jgi:hypothetical protein
MEPTQQPKDPKEGPATKPTEKRWSKKWWLSVGSAGVLGIGGLVYGAIHKAVEKVWR